MIKLLIIVFEIKIVKCVSSLGIYLFIKPFSTGAAFWNKQTMDGSRLGCAENNKVHITYYVSSLLMITKNFN
jgi:hypothetical protein